MGESDIQVILNELKNIKDDIAEIKDDIKHKCDSCVNASTFRERLRSQWTHILGVWAVIGVYFGYRFLGK
jgi:uncharacterized membrane protein